MARYAPSVAFVGPCARLSQRSTLTQTCDSGRPAWEHDNGIAIPCGHLSIRVASALSRAPWCGSHDAGIGAVETQGAIVLLLLYPKDERHVAKKEESE